MAQLDYESPRQRRIVWGYFSCAIPAIAFFSDLAVYSCAALLGVDRPRLDTALTVLLALGCLAGVGFGVTGILRDQRKRRYAVIGTLLSAVLLALIVW